jgi:hypothetical protein
MEVDVTAKNKTNDIILKVCTITFDFNDIFNSKTANLKKSGESL